MHIFGIKPEKTYQAELGGFEIEFYQNGKSGLKQAKGKKVHGVVHLVTKFQMDQIESLGYYKPTK